MRVWPDGAPPARKISDWRSAEVNALEWMRWLGHRDARATQPGADGGIDVIAAGAFAQVKLYGKPIPVTLMRQLHGARANRPGTLYFFANNGYTAKAAEFAEMVGMAAFRYSTASGLITAESSAARTLFNAAADRAAETSSPSAKASCHSSLGESPLRSPRRRSSPPGRAARTGHVPERSFASRPPHGQKPHLRRSSTCRSTTAASTIRTPICGASSGGNGKREPRGPNRRRVGTTVGASGSRTAATVRSESRTSPNRRRPDAWRLVALWPLRQPHAVVAPASAMNPHSGCCSVARRRCLWQSAPRSSR